MFGDKTSKHQDRIDSLIGEGTTVEGTVIFNGRLRVDGRVKGSVLTTNDQPGTLVLGERARVDGEIRVSHAIINGTVVGPLYGKEYVELQSKCSVTGDVHYKVLEVKLGAMVQGRLAHHGEEKIAKIVPVKVAARD